MNLARLSSHECWGGWVDLGPSVCYTCCLSVPPPLPQPGVGVSVQSAVLLLV